MYKKNKILIAIIFLGLLSGCANIKKMPLQENTSSIDLSKQTILVGKLNISNENAKAWQPNLARMVLLKDGKSVVFTKPTLVSKVPKVGREFLFSLASEPGASTLTLIGFLSSSLLINGSGELKFNQELTFPENGIAYIGNIDAKIVKRKEGEPRAGILIPLIDQSVTGFSTGTFVVDITDNFDEDIKLILQKYPYLKDQEITKMILPDWEYPSKK